MSRDSTALPLADASRRLRGQPGRPRRLLAPGSAGPTNQGAPLAPAPDAAKMRDFAASLPPRGLPIWAAAAYSGVPVRRLWAYIAEGRLRPIRLPGMRRVLLDRLELDALLDLWRDGGPEAFRSAP